MKLQLIAFIAFHSILKSIHGLNFGLNRRKEHENKARLLLHEDVDDSPLAVASQEQVDLWAEEIYNMTDGGTYPPGFILDYILVGNELIGQGPKYVMGGPKYIYVMAYIYEKLGKELLSSELVYSSCEDEYDGAYNVCETRLLALEFCTNDPACDEAEYEQLQYILMKPRDAVFNTELAAMTVCVSNLDDSLFAAFDYILADFVVAIEACEMIIENGNQGEPGYANITAEVEGLQDFLLTPTYQDGPALIDHPILGCNSDITFFIIDGKPTLRMYPETWLKFYEETLTPLNLFDIQITSKFFRDLFYHSGGNVLTTYALSDSAFEKFRSLAFNGFMFGIDSTLTNFEPSLLLDFMEIRLWNKYAYMFGLALANSGVSDTAGIIAVFDDILGDNEVLYITKDDIEHEATKHLIDHTLSSLKGCTDSVIRFLVDYNSNGKYKSQSCNWAAKSQTAMRCAVDGVSAICADTCKACTTCADSTLRLRIPVDGALITKDCTWVAAKATIQRCGYEGVAEACRSTCGTC